MAIRLRRSIVVTAVLVAAAFVCLVFVNLGNMHQRQLDFTSRDADIPPYLHMHEKRTMAVDNCKAHIEVRVVDQYENAKIKSHPIEFLPQLRNPCWWEYYNLTDIDNILNNSYIETKPFTDTSKDLHHLASILKERLKKASKNHNIRLRCLPFFNIIGQVKCGTTDLFYRLARHPQIEKGPSKEPYWWSHGSSTPFASYVDFYGFTALKIEDQLMANLCNDSKSDVGIIGEGSVVTFSNKLQGPKGSIYGQKPPSNDTPNFVKWVLPQSKLIVILRNPITRLLSDYLYYGQNGSVSQWDFHNRTLHAISVFKNCSRWHGDAFCMDSQTIRDQCRLNISEGLYSVVMKEWLHTFPRQNILVLKTEDYIADKAATLQEVYKFLDLRAPNAKENRAILIDAIGNKGHLSIGDMLASTRQVLYDYYQPYNVELAELLNDKRFLW